MFKTKIKTLFKAKNIELYLGLLILLIIVSVIIFSNILYLNGGMNIDLSKRLTPPFQDLSAPLGTDTLGRDILARIAVGGKVSLTVGVLSVLGGGILGVLIGLIAGYYRGFFDIFLMRFGDVQLALPFILIAIVFITILGPSMWNIIIFMILSQWVEYARVVRSQVLSLRQRDFVLSSKTFGVKDLTILFRHILPNSMNTVLILMVLNVGNNILLESSLTFLGLGSDPSIPSWGGMLANGRNYMQLAWWVCVFPGLAIMITVLGINLIGDYLRDKMDPKSYEKY